MERLETETASDIRLAADEIQPVLDQLHQRLADREVDLRPTASDVAEATGATPGAVAQALSEVREARAKSQVLKTQARKRQRLRSLSWCGLAVAAAVAILNFPLGGETPFTVVGVETQMASSYAAHPGFDKAVDVSVELEYHPPTLWRRLVGPSVDAPFGTASLSTPRGKYETFPTKDGSSFGLRSGPFYSLSGTRLHMGYAYPDLATTKGAMHITQSLDIDGRHFDLVVALP